MNDTYRHDSSDLLERSIGAIRRAQAPPGPDRMAVADTLAAVRRAIGEDDSRTNESSLVNLFWKAVAMTYLHKKAVTLTVAAGGLAAWVAVLLTGAFPAVSFAQVAEKLRNVHSMTCTARATLPGQPHPMSVKMEYLGKKMRSEIGDSVVSITDSETGQAMVLDLKGKTARVAKVDVADARPKSPFEMDPVEELRKLAGKKSDPAGEQQIGPVKAKGFRASQDGWAYTVWVNPATDMPVRIEVAAEVAGTKMIVTLDDLAFDVPLDEKQFSLEPPAGYVVTRQDLSFSMNVEENVVTILRAAKAAKGGKLPAHLDDMAWVKPVSADDKGNPTPEMLKLETAFGALRGLLFTYEKRKTYDYLPEVKPGDDKAIVFWRRVKDSDKIMAVFGDLTIHEIKPEQVPPPSKSYEPPQPQPVH